MVSNPISGGRHVFSAAVLAGDQTKIDNFKKEIRSNCSTSKLVIDGDLSTVLSLSPALRLRFESEPNTGKIIPVTPSDFTRIINSLRDKSTSWNFQAVIAFAKDDVEAVSFRKIIKAAAADKQYENIVFIDALSTPLGIESFEQYVDYSSMAMYYRGNNNSESRENDDKAKRILNKDWKDRIYNGQFIVYTYTNQEGEKLGNAQGVASILQTVVTARFPYIREFDFNGRLSENLFKLTNARASAKCGIIRKTSGVVVSTEKHVLPTVWTEDKYWEIPHTATLPISKIKIDVDNLIKDAFDRDGNISIGEIYNLLEEKYGFAPCNLSAFLAGFLLKEYGNEQFRYSDSSGGHESMTQDKLSEMLGNYIGKNPKPKPTYIVKMTPEEKAFYELTEKAWGITPNSCSSAGQAASVVTVKMRKLGLPVWCLAEIDDNGVYEVVQKYIELVQKEGRDAHKKAVEIGKIATIKTTLSEKLEALLTVENCQRGMIEFLKSFEGGKVLSLANEIGASGNVLADIRALFEVEYSCLWEKQTGEEQIHRLITDYSVVKQSNLILNGTAHSRSESFKEWREHLSFIHVSCEALQAKFPALSKVFDILLKIYKQSDILPEQIKMFLSELTLHGIEIRDLLNNKTHVFSEVYAPYLDGLSDADINKIESNLTTRMFEHSKTDCNTKVKATAEEFRKNQLKTKLFSLWQEKTGTKNPREWSQYYRTPILCCVPENEFDEAKKSFDTLNRTYPMEMEIKAALEFLEKTSLFEVLNDENKRKDLFEHGIIGEYKSLLSNSDKVRDELERMTIDTYDWHQNPNVKSKIKQIAEAEYNAGGSDKALNKIDKMNDAQLKQYLKRLIRENMTVGIEIITSGGE